MPCQPKQKFSSDIGYNVSVMIPEYSHTNQVIQQIFLNIVPITNLLRYINIWHFREASC